MGQGGEGGCFVVIVTLLEATAADLLVAGRSNAYLAQTGVGGVIAHLADTRS